MKAVGLTGWAASLRQANHDASTSPRGPPIWEEPAVEDAEPGGTRFEILHRLASTRASQLECQEGMRAACEGLEQERSQTKVLKSELERTQQALQTARGAASTRRALERGAEEHSISLVQSHTAISQQNIELSADSARLHLELARRDEREIKLRAASANRRSELMLQRRAQQQARCTSDGQLDRALDALRAEQTQSEELQGELAAAQRAARQAAVRVEATRAQLHAEVQAAEAVRARCEAAEGGSTRLRKELKQAAQREAAGMQRASVQQARTSRSIPHAYHMQARVAKLQLHHVPLPTYCDCPLYRTALRGSSCSCAASAS